MEKIYLDAEARNQLGTQRAQKVRATGAIPAIICRKGTTTTHIMVNERQFTQALHTKAGENVIITLRMKDKGATDEKTVLIKDVQHHPLKDTVLHVDFSEISLTEKIRVKVPLHDRGEAIGVKQEGGVLEHLLWEIEVECLPTNIPEKIMVDISNLKIGDSVFVKSLTAPEGVVITSDPEGIVASVKHPHVEKAAEPTAEVTEPELIRAKKEEEGDEAAAEEAPAAEQKKADQKKPEPKKE